MALVFIRLVSRAAARHCRTLLCCQVYRPCNRLVLQPIRICLRFAGDGQGGHVVFSLYHWLRLEGEGRVSYMLMHLLNDQSSSLS